MTEKRILLLSFYFRPDLCAGSFRASALLDELLARNLSSLKIDIITTLPNRYSSFNCDAPAWEQVGNVTIHRVKLPDHKSGMLDQATAFLFFARAALLIAKKSPYDLIFATSSRLMTAVLGAWIAKFKRCPLYLDVRDIFVDTIGDILSKKMAFLLTPFFSLVERLAFKQASHINLVSGGFESYFKDRYPAIPVSFFTNGIDDDFLNRDFSKTVLVNDFDRPINVLYAGNIGEGQGLHAILPKLAQLTGQKLVFKIYGDGGRKSLLENEISKFGIDNVKIYPPISRDKLLAEYLAADVLFLHLNDYDAFKKVLPSKIFEYAALGKPIWAGVGGYAAKFLVSEVSNVAVFSPCNAAEAVSKFNTLSIRDTPRKSFVEKFQRKAIMKLMVDDILSYLPEESHS